MVGWNETYDETQMLWLEHTFSSRLKGAMREFLAFTDREQKKAPVFQASILCLHDGQELVHVWCESPSMGTAAQPPPKCPEGTASFRIKLP